MTIYIVRHAWAGEFGDPNYPNDFFRPLTPEGCERFAHVVSGLIKLGFAPQAVATSPLVRCRQTAEIVVAHVTPSPDLVEHSALEPGSDLQEMLDWTRSRGDQEHVAWVGHAPDVGYMLEELVGHDMAYTKFKKGACAAIEFEGEPANSQGRLAWFVTAKDLEV